jgi:hypothetical protein
MTQAPKRVFASPKHLDDWSNVDCGSQKVFGHDVEYIRADLADALVRLAYSTAIEDVAAEADSWSDEMIHANDVRDMPQEPSDETIAAIVESVVDQ